MKLAFEIGVSHDIFLADDNAWTINPIMLEVFKVILY
jgi:hypothetical protein